MELHLFILRFHGYGVRHGLSPVWLLWCFVPLLVIEWGGRHAWALFHLTGWLWDVKQKAVPCLLPCLGRGGLVRSKEKRETGKRSGLVAKWCFQVFFGCAVNCWKLQENKFALSSPWTRYIRMGDWWTGS